MQKINCHLLCDSNSPHLSQLYTGFYMLHKAGIVHLTQSIIPGIAEGCSHEVGPSHLSAIITGKIRIHYDTSDSSEVNISALSASHYYFKRSYSKKNIIKLGNKERKVFALGLNYEVYPNSIDPFGFYRAIRLSKGKERVRNVLRSLGAVQDFFYIPRVSNMECLPSFDLPPRVIFMAQAWDPHDDPLRTKKKIEERILINEMRARCIKLLREHFKKDFFGGFIQSKFARNNYGDFLINDKIISLKKNYTRIVKQFPICVSTTGLHGSIGWKFGEYIAFSRAIVCEKLDCDVPGSLQTGKNYLEFSCGEDCVNGVAKLFDNYQLRFNIMENNQQYYLSFLRPDQLVLNTLRVALGGGRCSQ